MSDDATTRLQVYLEKNYPIDGGAIFGRWNFEQIMRDKYQWKPAIKWLTLYAIVNEGDTGNNSNSSSAAIATVADTRSTSKKTSNRSKSRKPTTQSTVSASIAATASTTVTTATAVLSHIKSYVGCVENLELRLKQHRGEISSNGGRTATTTSSMEGSSSAVITSTGNNGGGGGGASKKIRREDWRIIVKILIPPFRNFSSKTLKRACQSHTPNTTSTTTTTIDASREWTIRCIKTIRVAVERGLKCEISRQLVKRHSSLYVSEIRRLYKDNRHIVSLF